MYNYLPNNLPVVPMLISVTPYKDLEYVMLRLGMDVSKFPKEHNNDVKIEIFQTIILTLPLAEFLLGELQKSVIQLRGTKKRTSK